VGRTCIQSSLRTYNAPDGGIITEVCEKKMCINVHCSFMEIPQNLASACALPWFESVDSYLTTHSLTSANGIMHDKE
jgi:hypothetical protein